MQRLIALDPDTFAERVWGREPLLSRAAELDLEGFSDLLSQQAVDELVATRGLRSPFLRVAKEGDTLPDNAFTAAGGVGAGIGDQVSDDKLLKLMADGATLVLQGLHRIWPPLINFSQQLAAELGHPVQVNAYVTPSQNKGFSDHYDVHDVFVLQVEGEKQWTLHEPVFSSPLRDQPWGRRRSAVEAAARQEPLLETVLRPGDCLYLPRGYLHAAKALGGVSTHITIGVHSWTRHHVAERLVTALLDDLKSDPDLRRSLDYGLSLEDADGSAVDLDMIRTKIIKAAHDVDPGTVLAALRRDARDAQRASPIGPLHQLEAASHLNDQDLLKIRPHLSATIDTHNDGNFHLVSRAGDLALSPADASVVTRLLSGESLTVGEIDRELARRLLINGVAVCG